MDFATTLKDAEECIRSHAVRYKDAAQEVANFALSKDDESKRRAEIYRDMAKMEFEEAQCLLWFNWHMLMREIRAISRLPMVSYLDRERCRQWLSDGIHASTAKSAYREFQRIKFLHLFEMSKLVKRVA